jgi:hypothetical protein
MNAFAVVAWQVLIEPADFPAGVFAKVIVDVHVHAFDFEFFNHVNPRFLARL